MANILIVDDSKDLTDFLSMLLKLRKFTVETASSKEELELKLPDFVPDLILLDVRLNGKDGRELCREIKSRTQHKPIPIILLSASPELLHNYHECNADDLIEKPFDISTMLTKIDNQLKSHQDPKASGSS